MFVISPPASEEEQVCAEQPCPGSDAPMRLEHGQVMEVELLLLKFKQSVSSLTVAACV